MQLQPPSQKNENAVTPEKKKRSICTRCETKNTNTRILLLPFSIINKHTAIKTHTHTHTHSHTERWHFPFHFILQNRFSFCSRTTEVRFSVHSTHPFSRYCIFAFLQNHHQSRARNRNFVCAFSSRLLAVCRTCLPSH